MRSVRQPDLSDGAAVDSGFDLNSGAAEDSHVETTGGAEQGNEFEVTGGPALESRVKQTNDTTTCEEFLRPGTVCAVAAADNSSELMWFILITSQGVATEIIEDDYEHTIYEGERYLLGRYMEFHTETSKQKRYRVMKESVFIRYESVLHPFVGHEMTDNICKISMTEFSEILNYIDNSGMKYI